MLIVTVIVIFIAACLMASAGLWAFLRIQPRIGLLDIPNDRSSHTQPVPRGGGVVVVTVIHFLYVAASLSAGKPPDHVFIATGLLISAVSLADDVRSIPLFPRLLTHLFAASVLVWYSGGYTGINADSFGVNIQFGQIGPIISVLFIVWMINAYNFMDGIDGILGIQSLVGGAAWAVCGVIFGSLAQAVLGAAIAGACVGFLFFNWQPARVFMGDVGSTFLGFVLASAPLIASGEGEFDRNYALLMAVCFSGLFLFDTLYTRVALVLKGARFWLPHREHLYQKLVRSGIPHRTVSAYFGAASAIISGFGLAAMIMGGVYPAITVGAGLAASVFLLIRANKKLIDVNIG